MTSRTLLCLGLLAPLLAAQEPADPMKWIPRKAGLVIVLNRPSQALARWDKLGERLKSKEMALVRQALTQDFGGLPLLDPDASLVEFMIPAPAPKAPAAAPGKGPGGPPARAKDLQFRILAFQKKEAFQARFKPADMGKAATDFTTVTVGGKPMVAAVRGRLAFLGPKDSGPMLKALLADKARFPMPPDAEAAWAASQDLAFLVSIPALKDRKPAAAPAKTSAPPPVWSPLAKLGEALKAHPERELSSFVMGLRLSEGGDLTGSLRMGVAPGGELAALTAGLDQGGGPDFRGLAAGPFALAFGMAFPAAWADGMALAVAEEAKKDPKADAVAVSAMQGLFRELRGFGLALRAPREGAPMASGLGLAFSVADARSFMKQATTLAERPGKDGKPGLRTAPAKFQGRSVTTFTQLPAAPAKDGDPGAEGPSMMPPPEALFGSKEVKTSLLVADDHTIIAGFGDTEAAFQAGLDSLGKGGLGQLPRLQRTRELLGGGKVGQGVFYLSLPETLQMAGAFLPIPVREEDLNSPVPPLGLALNIGSSRIEVNLALPTETLALIGRIAGAASEMRKAPKE
ncbi:MAG: hypothetical protein IPL96_14610 [Holophagaceae bacterium]|nr:hypothetical protein [Holophagaceae bacterium]